MMRSLLLVLAGALASGPASAAPPTKPTSSPPAPSAAAPAPAACAVPVPPPVGERPARPSLPPKPACLDAKEGCPGWEAYSYNDAVKAYNIQGQAYRPLAEAYLQKLNAYVKASSAYAQCEAEAMQR